ncbi:MAG: flagellar basal body P-ring formation protein FlgA [Sedimentisphaerales bacterium]|nr:flagellar basal body P-ring formation protein FlgA [Sedimentisphaerales bacterium]
MHKWRRTVRWILLLTAAATPPAAGVLEIRLQPRAQLAAGAVCLRDVAQVRADSSELTDRLNGLVIYEFSGQIQTASVGLFEITRALARANVNPAAACIFGASRCRLARTPQDLAADPASPAVEAAPPEPAGPTLADRLNQTVAQLAGLDPEILHIQWRCRPEGRLAEPAGERRFEIRPCSTVELGEVSFEVSERAPAEPAGPTEPPAGPPESFRVYGRVEMLCTAVVARRAIRPGEVINLADVELQSRRIASMQDRGMSRLDEVVGREAARGIPANEMVSAAMIRRIRLVKRQQNVELISRVGAVEIKVTGKALADGVQDEVISVTYGKQKIMVQGRVTGPGQVTVGAGDSAPSPAPAAAGSAAATAAANSLSIGPSDPSHSERQ